MNNDFALVLGGGGATGNAWEIGVLAGLADGGVDATILAGVTIGTSAGATATAQLGGASVADLYAALLAEPTAAPPRAAGGPRRGPAVPNVFERLREIGAAATSALSLQQALGAFALECDEALADGADSWRATVASRLTSHDWPQQRIILVAVDAESGELAPLERDSGVDLVDAVTASCSLPGMVATRAAAGRRLIDGGVRSTENADLARGFTHVLILSPLGARAGQAAPPGGFEGIRREAAWGTTLGSQVELLRSMGSSVEVLHPDAATVKAMGPNMMSPAVRVPVARTGHAQGLREAARLQAWLEA